MLLYYHELKILTNIYFSAFSNISPSLLMYTFFDIFPTVISENPEPPLTTCITFQGVSTSKYLQKIIAQWYILGLI